VWDEFFYIACPVFPVHSTTTKWGVNSEMMAERAGCSLVWLGDRETHPVL